jgi:hypothetical protein
MNYTHKLARRLARLRPAAVPAACGRWSSDRKIGHNRAIQHHFVRRTLPILTLVLLLAACADSSAPVAPDGGVVDLYQVGRGWTRRLVGIHISPDTAVVSPGETVAFKASGVLTDGSSRPITVAWAATGGTIDSAGLFTADSTMGTYRVVGTELALGLADTAAVVDTAASVDAPAPDAPPPAVSSVSVSPSSATLAVGQSVQLTAAAKDVDGSPVDGSPITWTTSNSAVASVTSSGVVKALAGGSAKVTATAQGVSGEAAVSVTAPAPTPQPAGDCSNYSYTRLVPVSTASQLTDAITDARPGDMIQLTDGVYSGRFTGSVSGTAANLIVLCGSRKALLDGGSITSGIGIKLSGTSYWVLRGFTVANSLKGVVIEGGRNNVVDYLEVKQIGQEGMHILKFSAQNRLTRNYIHDTGRSVPGWGEGVYIGSSNSNWCSYTNCQPDASDDNQVVDNVIGPNIGAQMVDVKEGTTGTVLTGNTFNGIGGSSAQDAWVNVFGNEATVTNNSGTAALMHGYKLEALVSGWGARNVFHGNVSDLAGGTGYGFKVGAGPASTIVLGCDNTVTNADSGFATVPCTR